MAPHGNSRSSQPYTGMMPSMLSKMKEQAQKNTPKHALIQFVSNEVDGIPEATSAGAIYHAFGNKSKMLGESLKARMTLTHCSLLGTCAKKMRIKAAQILGWSMLLHIQ